MNRQGNLVNLVAVPVFPFQKIYAECLFIKDVLYLLTIDCYSSWVCVYGGCKGGITSNVHSMSLINLFRQHFQEFGVAETVVSTDNMLFTCQEFKNFLTDWHVSSILSVSSIHIENVVNTVKGLFVKANLPGGGVDLEVFDAGLCDYYNTVDLYCGKSPASIILGRSFDNLLHDGNAYYPRETWKSSLMFRELGLMRRHYKFRELDSDLKPLWVGDNVYIKGTSNKISRSGVVVELSSFAQYYVRLDGSGRVLLVNRSRLVKFSPFQPSDFSAMDSVVTETDPLMFVVDPMLAIPPPPTNK